MGRFIAELVFGLAILFTVVRILTKLITAIQEDREYKRKCIEASMGDAIRSGGYQELDVFLALHGDSLSKDVKSNLQNLRAERYADSDGGRAPKKDQTFGEAVAAAFKLRLSYVVGV